MFRGFVFVLMLSIFANGYDYLKKPQVQRFVNMMHKRYGFSYDYLKGVFRKAHFDKETLGRYSGRFKQNSTIGSWDRFKLHIINKPSFAVAHKFAKRNKKILLKAQRVYGVDAEYIVGFLGVESGFGKFTGNYNILDALATLAFHPNRKQRFFKSELKELFLFAKERGYDVSKLKGSFAGAMGCVQQLPSVARRFNVDFDSDGASVWDIEDCIGSIASFMRSKGWRKGVPAAIEAKESSKNGIKSSFRHTYAISSLKRAGIIPKEPFYGTRAYLLRVRGRGDRRTFLGTKNTKVLTSYNPSTSYAIGIHLLAKEVKGEFK